MHIEAGISFSSVLPYVVLSDEDVIAGLPRPWKTLQARYKNQLKKAHSSRIQLRFLTRCKEEQVLPITFLPERLRHLNGLPFDTMEHTILDKCIIEERNHKNTAFVELAARKREIDLLPFYERSIIYRHCSHVLDRNIKEITAHLDDKLNYLISTSSWTKMANHKFYINLSSTPLDEDTKCALGFGLNFTFQRNSMNPIKAALSLQKFERIANDHTDLIRGLIYGAMHTNKPFTTIPLRFLNALIKLKENPNLHITKGDKANVLVIMNKVEYINKIEEQFNNPLYYAKVSNTDKSLDLDNGKFHSKLRNIIQNKKLSDTLSSRGSTRPYAYGLVKTHKVGMPMRLIISNVGSCTNKLAQF